MRLEVVGKTFIGLEIDNFFDFLVVGNHISFQYFDEFVAGFFAVEGGGIGGLRYFFGHDGAFSFYGF